MRVNRTILSQALRQNINQPNVSKTYLSASDAQQQLLTGQGISNFAVNSANFGYGQAGGVGLAAQLATAGIGAFAQNRARKNIAEQELASQQSFATQFPQYAELAGQLSPETRQAYTVESMKQQLKANDPMEQLKIQGERLNQQKTIAETNKLNKESSGKLITPEQNFKNATSLRSDYLNNSKTFQATKEGYERVNASFQDPSPAGDLALIFNYVKTLDPSSTVREGEFAQAAKAGSYGDKIEAAYNQVSNGKRLSQDQRKDFMDRATRLYKQADRSQQKVVSQYTDIAKRNNINPQDIIVDFSTTVPQEPATLGQSPIPHPQANDAIAILKKRGVVK